MDRTESRLAQSPEPASDDVASPLNSIAPSGAGGTPPGELPPWEIDLPEEAGRQRHDAFTGARKQLYLKALARTGCILDACRMTGISSSTVYNHQASDPDFARHCQLALAMASTPIELTAYERAVVGHEEPVFRGGKIVGTRIKRSDYMLRILLQASNPKKYGPRPGFTRKRLLKFERARIEREVRAEMAVPKMTFEDSIVMLDKALDAFGDRNDARRREQGWTELGCGVWVPPGWVWAGEGDPREALASLQKNNDAVCNSSNSSPSEPPEPPEPPEPFEHSEPVEPDPGPIEYKSLTPPDPGPAPAPAGYRQGERGGARARRTLTDPLPGLASSEEWKPFSLWLRRGAVETRLLRASTAPGEADCTAERRTFPPPRAFPR